MKKIYFFTKLSLLKTIVCSLALFCSFALSAQHYPASNIENLTTATGKLWKVETDLGIGSVLFIDRTYTVEALHSSFVGATHIRPANDDRSYGKDDLATFTVKTAADVYIGHSQGITSKPNWFAAEYDEHPYPNADSDITVFSNAETYRFWKKTFAAGSTVTLGKNGNNQRSMYIVIVKPGEASGVDNLEFFNDIRISDKTITCAEKGNVTIYNVSGALVLGVNNVDRVDVNLPAGMYIAHFVGESGKKGYKKFIIN